MTYAVHHKAKKSREATARWRLRHPEKAALADRVHHLKSEYGLSLQDFNTMLINQDHSCAICGGPLSTPYIDHDHITQCVRDLLCRRCNLVLGHIKDSTALLQKFIEYLRDWDE